MQNSEQTRPDQAVFPPPLPDFPAAVRAIEAHFAQLHPVLLMDMTIGEAITAAVRLRLTTTKESSNYATDRPGYLPDREEWTETTFKPFQIALKIGSSDSMDPVISGIAGGSGINEDGVDYDACLIAWDYRTMTATYEVTP